MSVSKQWPPAGVVTGAKMWPPTTAGGGGGGAVSSVTGSVGVTTSPTTGAVAVKANYLWALIGGAK